MTDEEIFAFAEARAQELWGDLPCFFTASEEETLDAAARAVTVTCEGDDEMIPEEVDAEFGWPEGTALRLVTGILAIRATLGAPSERRARATSAWTLHVVPPAAEDYVH